MRDTVWLTQHPFVSPFFLLALLATWKWPCDTGLVGEKWVKSSEESFAFLIQASQLFLALLLVGILTWVIF